ncbi:aminotransferase class I/II-fold pyridoxal phosphate-dependent enzyme [Nosocomiicoccus massiliensis]|uniref:Aminotransferase class I/II-fold pyridoxal phosphate-dependent enzyme n=1 Tax=Nosocomiicoccus massiliensis TaxID=1232430 RepID=A0AAF0YMS3_9STAP|nr:aminotransferase class I/II-fold pyridoxal phosphate-dependent enzyme [Nosocomiicoccus massiliensis]WOS96339.1 aminotransferase class I/II-fold pyridoxal phosphate-dependent enzyme [Nosocomiicoccus massiliensis]
MTHALEIIKQSEIEIEPLVKQNKQIAYDNFKKVMQSFNDHSVMESDFTGTTGYGYDDTGRDKLEDIYRDIFKAEDALVRAQIISGTHAISLSLLSLLERGDELLYITGWPYDTLEKVIGDSEEDVGSMKALGIDFNYVDLIDDKAFDIDAILNNIKDNTKVIGIQRSRGYSTRKSLTIEQIEAVIKTIKERHPNIIVFVDNCYGEFVERREPIEVGADIAAGSLIKNPGGGLAKMGGYVVGRKDLIERVSYRLTVPGIGKEMGASLEVLLDMYQGLFMAPHAVIESLNGALLTSHVLTKLGYRTDPLFDETRTDLIQSIQFNTEEEMISFIQMVQSASPVNSKFLPIPDLIPGYQHPVIMAAGTFIQGASLELSADGPVREPYIAFMQGGLVYEHVKYALEKVLTHWSEKGII